MRATLALYLAHGATTWGVQRRYPVTMCIWVFGVALEPVIYLAVWRTAAGGHQVGGFTRDDFAAYYVLVMLVNHLSYTWFFMVMDRRTREGTFSALLLRPAHPIHGDVAENLTFKAITSVAVVPTAGLLWVSMGVRLQPAPLDLLLAVVGMLTGAVLRVCLEWTLALGALWTTRVESFGRVYAFVSHFLGGFVAPLAALPSALHALATWTPFPWMVAFPIEVAMGRHSVAEAIEGILVQGLWLLGSLGLLRAAWRRALRRHTAVGG
ncbi:ABC transporter permease [Streptomyces avermitilis]|uniref:ABC transporter permease n=2 Tax=Streptomyces avermitilis TaxID=33903 RepID=UPI00381A2088